MKFCSLLFSLMVSMQVNADDESSVTLYTNPLAFFSTTTELGEHAGYSVELSTAILTRAGINANITALPWARIIKTSATDELSLITGMVRTPEREENYHWITPISRNPVAMYALRGRYKSIDSLAQVNQFESVAVLRDDYRQTILDDIKATNTVAFNTWQQAIGSLLKERVQGLFFSDMGMALVCARNQFNCSDVQKVFTHQTAVSYLVMRKTDRSGPYAEKLIAAAKEYKNSNAFLHMAAKHLSGPGPVAHSMVLLDGIIGIEK